MIIAGIKSLVTGLLRLMLEIGNAYCQVSGSLVDTNKSLHWHANHIIAHDRYKINEFQQQLLGFHFRVLECIPYLLALWHAHASISLVRSAISLVTEPLIDQDILCEQIE